MSTIIIRTAPALITMKRDPAVMTNMKGTNRWSGGKKTGGAEDIKAGKNMKGAKKTKGHR
jgi:hypothetical protein